MIGLIVIDYCGGVNAGYINTNLLCVLRLGGKNFMTRIFWNGDAPLFIDYCKTMQDAKFFKAISKNLAFIISRTLSKPESEELNRTLKYGSIVVNEFKETMVDSDSVKKMIFEMGRLSGIMQLSSQINRDANKKRRLDKSSLSYSGIRRFDEIVALLAKYQMLSHGDLCEKLQMNPPTLSERMKTILNTQMVECRRVGKFKMYSLSSDGRYYARTHQSELISKNTEKTEDRLSTTKWKIDSTNSSIKNRYVIVYSLTKNYEQCENNNLQNNGVIPKTAEYDKTPDFELDNELEIVGNK